MIRAKVHLTQQERAALAAISAATGKSRSEIIREAIDNLIAQSSKARREAVLDQVAGLWKDRNDLPDFAAIRKQWDRCKGLKPPYVKK